MRIIRVTSCRGAEKIFIALLILFLAATAGCSRNSDKDTAGGHNSAGITGPEFRRIISTAPSNTEIVIGLGLGEYLIAVDKYSRGISGLPVNLTEIDFTYPDAEALVGLEPDLILMHEINYFGMADDPFKLLGNLGITVVKIPTSVSIEGIYGDIMMIAGILGVPERGESMVRSMKDEIESVAAAAEKNTGEKAVYFEVSGTPTIVTFGQGTYINEMIELSGGKNIFADQKGWFSPSAEEIINRNPDVILVMQYPGSDPVPEIKSRREFANLTAIREDRIFAIGSDEVSRPSQHILTALRDISGAINQQNEAAR